MKGLKNFILENSADDTEYIYVDEKNGIVYLSTGRTGSNASTVFTDLMEFSGFRDTFEFLHTKNGWDGIESGTAAFITGHMFDSAAEANKFAEVYKKTCDFNAADKVQGDWDWYCDGVVYVTKDGDGCALMTSALNGGSKLNAEELNKVIGKMTKIK